MTDTIARLLIELVHHDEFFDSRAIAADDLEPTRRSELATLLRDGHAIPIAPHIYALREPSGALMLAQYGDPGPPDLPAPHHIAAALARQHGWRLALPVPAAKYLLGLGERPRRLDSLPYDQNEPRTWPKLGLTLVPAPTTLLALTPAGQALVQAVPHEASGRALLELAQQAAIAAPITHPTMLAWLSEDLAAERLGERERCFASALLAAIAQGARPRRCAPAAFAPPQDPVVSVDDWITVERGGVLFLAAGHIRGHPHIVDGDSLTRSSPLVWIDIDAGWAQTQSRLYHLGRSREEMRARPSRGQEDGHG